MKIAFGYYGGKFSKLSFILPQLNTSHRIFVELCGGSAAVLLNKQRAEKEVLNDLSNEVITFWRVLREQPDELIRQIKQTPPGESEFKRILKLPPSDDAVETARRFFTHVAQTFSGMPAGKTHVMYGGHRLIRYRANLESVVNRISDVIIENTDASRLIKRVVFAEAPLRCTPILFYADPPYPEETRTATPNEYLCDDFNHDEFLDTVLDAPDFCKFAISGYAHPLYDNRLADWHRVEWEVPLKARNNGKQRAEILWRNYELNDTAKLF